MRPTRRTQPFRRKLARQPGIALAAAMRGRAAGGVNPRDVDRVVQKRSGKLARKMRRRAMRR